MPASLSLPLVITLALPPQDAAPVLDRMATEQQKRWSTVENFTVIQQVQGIRSPLYYQRVKVGDQFAFRMVPPPEWDRVGGMSHEETVEFSETMATGLEMLGDSLGSEVSGPGGAYIKSMTSDMSFFLRQVKEYDPEELSGDQAADAAMAKAFRARVRRVGTETVGGRPVIVIRADGLKDVPMPRKGDGPVLRLQSVTLWIDQAAYVPVRTRMEGLVDGSGTPLVIELEELDYAQFGPLFEPTRRVMRLSGIMEASATDPKKKRELEQARESARKAQADLKKMEDQVASMPAAQRRLIEGQVNRARQQMAMLASGDELVMEVGLEVIGINAGPPRNWRP